MKNVSTSKQIPLFLASDSARLKSAMNNISRSEKITLLHSKVRALHVMRSSLSTNIGNSSESNFESFLNVFVEFFDLAGAKILISSGSEFSRLAFLFGDASRLIVYNTEATTQCQ